MSVLMKAYIRLYYRYYILYVPVLLFNIIVNLGRIFMSPLPLALTLTTFWVIY